MYKVRNRQLLLSAENWVLAGQYSYNAACLPSNLPGSPVPTQSGAEVPHHRRCHFRRPSGLLRLSRLHASSSPKKTSLPNTAELLPAQFSTNLRIRTALQSGNPDTCQPTCVSNSAYLGGIVSSARHGQLPDQQTLDRWNSIPLLCVSAKCPGKWHGIDK